MSGMRSTASLNTPTPPITRSSSLSNKDMTEDMVAELGPDDILVLQVRAFLDASEEVDMDIETAKDLMETIRDDIQESDEVDYISLNEDDDGDVTASEMDLDISALYTIADQAELTWSTQEIKEMMHHLKERGMSSWLKEYVATRNIPIPKLLDAFGINLCKQLRSKRPKTLMYFLRVAISRELRQREKITRYNSISDAINLIRSSKNIIILTGAGISVSCGIPDFRSRNGLYSTLKDRGDYELDDPQQMFDINYFRENPSVFYSFASQIYPSNFIPSPCHRFIKVIEDKNQLLRNYTQNIDTLETLTGVRRVLQCHGSFATASCLHCRRRVPGSEIEADILRQKVPLCTACNPPAESHNSAKKGKRRSRRKAKGKWDSDEEDESDAPEYPPGIMKPDITFFGEKLNDDFDNSLSSDRDKVDLLLVIGTSLKVSPVSEILSHLPHSVPQILINKTPVRHINPDIILLGNADEIIQYLCHGLGWDLPPPPPPPPSTTTRLYPARGNLKKRSSSKLVDRQEPRRVGDSHVYLFRGAEGGRWVENLEKRMAPPTLATSDIGRPRPSKKSRTR